MTLRSVVWLAAWSCASLGLNTAAHAQQLVSVNGRWYVMSNSPTVVTAAPTTSFVTMQPQWNSSLLVVPDSSSRSLSYSYGVDAGTTWNVAGTQANIFGWGSPFQPAASNPLLDRIETMLMNRFERWLDHELGLNPCPGTGGGGGVPAPGGGGGAPGPGGEEDPNEIFVESQPPGTASLVAPNNVATMQPQDLRNRAAYLMQAAQLQEQRTSANRYAQRLNAEYRTAAINAGLMAAPGSAKAKALTEDNRKALLEKADNLWREIQSLKDKQAAAVAEPPPPPKAN